MTLYLLENVVAGKYYIGTTNDIVRRIKGHNSDNNYYTGKNRGEWILVGIKDIAEESARKEERRLKKSKNKKYINWYFTHLGR